MPVAKWKKRLILPFGFCFAYLIWNSSLQIALASSPDISGERRCDTGEAAEVSYPGPTYLVSQNGSEYEIIGAFNGSDCEGSVVITNGVTTIGTDSFYAADITSLIIPDSVTNIGSQAFYNSLSLSSLELGNSLVSIGNYAFYRSESLTSLSIPNSVTDIGEFAFQNSVLLTSLTLGNSIQVIGDYAFDNSQFSTLILPDTVTAIGNYAFSNNVALTSLTLGESILTIGNSAFYGSGIEDLFIPDSVTSIGDAAFASSSNLSQVQIGLGVTSFGNGVFDDTNLAETESLNPGQQTVFYCGEDVSVSSANYDSKGSGPSCGDPGAPDLNSASVLSENSVRLAFTSPTFTGGAPVTQFEVSIRNPAGDVVLSTQTFTPSPAVRRGTSSTLTVTGLTPNTTYGFSLNSINSAGNGSYQSYLLTATTSNETAQAASQAAAQAAAQAASDAARRAKEQKELTELLSLIPAIGELALNIGKATKSINQNKCVKNKSVRFVKKGKPCPRGFARAR